jgi:hypothetical protein
MSEEMWIYWDELDSWGDKPPALLPIEVYQAKNKATSDGGPSDYYDFQPNWVTLNDCMEWLAVRRWGAYSLHLKDAMKACMRFGYKDTSGPMYDAKKIVYSGLRLIIMAGGVSEVRSFLQQCLEDPQFGGSNYSNLEEKKCDQQI